MDASGTTGPGEAFRLGHRRWLDGLRGVAILAVIAFHYNLRLAGGFLGVDLFFVISGFLITTLLLEERAATGTIRMGRFYLRRALRLVPALLLLVLALLAWASAARPAMLGALARESAVVLCFATNMTGRLHDVPMSHLHYTWSLSVEEQFYLVWPAVLLILLRLRVPAPLLAGGVVLGIAAVAAWRAHLHHALPPATDPLWFSRLWAICASPETRGDGPLCGCLAAVLIFWGVRARTPAARRLCQAATLLATASLAYCFCAVAVTDPRCFRGLFTVFSLSAATLIVGMVIAPPAPLRRALEWGPLVGAGRLSYGLFLFHLPVLSVLGVDPTHLGWNSPLRTLLVSVAALAVTAVSYFAVERPALRLKNRFGHRRGEASPAQPADTRPARMAA